MKILVVDDEVLVRESVINTLNSFGIDNILEAKDGFEALNLLNEIKPDVIIADIRMPGMDGIELLSKSKKLYEDIIFILLSGYDLFEYAQKAIQHGVFSYLLKPVSDLELKSIIDKAADALAQKDRQQELNSLMKIRIKPASRDTFAGISFKAEQDLLECFEKCDIKSAISIIESLYNPYKNLEITNIGDFHKLNFQLILLIYKIMNTFGVNPEELFGDEFVLYNTLNACSSINSVIEFLEKKLNICFESISLIREKGSKKLMGKAKEYIAINYNKDITLESISEHVHLSPAYFSKQFKCLFGENFVDYVINYRINKAKEFLKEGVYKATEVSKMIGFNNEKYFYKVFKKYTGFTPTEYKDI